MIKEKTKRIIERIIELKPIIRFLIEWIKWKTIGLGRYRSKKRISEIFEICSSCEKFDRFHKNEGNCSVCGCFIHRRNLKMNKASMVTTKCPLKPPKWK